MVITTLPLCPRKTGEPTTCDSILFRSIVLGLIVLCLPWFVGCADDKNSGEGLAMLAMAGKGHAYGLNPTINTIKLSPTGLAFSAIQGGSDPAAQTVAISDSGKGTLDWSVTTTAPWIALSPNSGTAPSSFTATVIVAGLAAGTYSTTITVTATGATNTPQSIPVDLTISTSASSTAPSSPSTSIPTTGSASLGSASLDWSPDTDPSIVGYYVHYGLQSPNSAGSCTYTVSTYYSLASLANGSSPTVTISGLVPGATYYFAVSAYNGLESACSNEVSKTT